MADIEVKNHVKKIHKIVVKKERSLLEKFKEVVLEIFIIVFAVSLSIGLHSWSEHKHEQKQVKKFLIGLKSDIQNDINDSKEMIQTYKKFGKVYSSLHDLNQNKAYDQTKLKEHLYYLKVNSSFMPNTYRFNGFVSSGQFGNIENDSLSINILKFYHDSILGITISDSDWISNQEKLKDYLDENLNDPENINDYWKLLTTPKGKRLTKNLIPWNQIYEQYNSLINFGQIIIKQIDEEYDLKE